jgi:hypothetical protein
MGYLPNHIGNFGKVGTWRNISGRFFRRQWKNTVTRQIETSHKTTYPQIYPEFGFTQFRGPTCIQPS